MSGCSRRTRHSATRRFSPPESVVTDGVARRQPQGVHGDVDGPVEVPEIERLDPLLQIALPLEQRGHLVVGHRLGKAGGDGLELGEQRPLLAHRFLDVAPHVLGGIEDRLLRQEADPGPLGGARLADEVLIHARP